jgi:hypothetical protein
VSTLRGFRFVDLELVVLTIALEHEVSPDAVSVTPMELGLQPPPSSNAIERSAPPKNPDCRPMTMSRLPRLSGEASGTPFRGEGFARLFQECDKCLAVTA